MTRTFNLPALWLAATLASHGLPVVIDDPSFENNGLSSGGWSTNLAPEWQESGGFNNGSGFEEWIPGFAATGTDHLGMTSGHDVWQDLGATYQGNTRYTLTVAAGNRPGNTDFGNQTVYALADATGEVYASSTFNASLLAAGSFGDAPALIFETNADPDAVGMAIRVLLQARGGGRSHFDDIRLDAVALTPTGGATVQNNPASAVASGSATLGGVVSDIGTDAPVVTIYYGNENGGVNPAAWDHAVVLPGTVNGAFSTAVGGLMPGTQYFHAALATNSSGDSWALPAGTFTTATLPASVENLPASLVKATTATVGAEVTQTGGDPPAVTIYYGPADGGLVAGNWESSRSLGVVADSATVPLSGLAPNTTYHFRAYAVNAAGGAWASSSGSFTTQVITPPAVVNAAPTGITGSGANLRGAVTDTGLGAPVVTIFYGTTDGGNTTSWESSVTVGIEAGAFTQFVGGLAPLTTYYYTARAVNAAGTAWATPSQSFTTSEFIANAVVINEIHYDPEPKTEAVDFIELYNAGSNLANLSGWRFSNGVSYAFPSGTELAPGDYLVVSRDPAAFEAKFGFVPFGPWEGTLSNEGELLRLVDAGNVVQDEVDYGVGFPWPTGSLDSGKSIELLHPNLDNDLGGHWRTGGERAGTGSALIPVEGNWRYFKGVAEPSPVAGAWRLLSFEDEGWPLGLGTLGYGEEFLNTLLADMPGGYSTLYLRREFPVADPAALNSLVLRGRYDDGFNAWINGTRVAWGNVGGENLAYTATASGGGENISYREFVLPDPQSYLVEGTNVLAVQLLNASVNSSDAFWDAELVVSTGSTAGLSPGLPNGSLSAFVPPAVRQVEHVPEQPASGDPVLITVKVTDPDGVGSVELAYQVVEPGNYVRRSDPGYENPSNWVALPMVDDGTAGDETAGDDRFTATVPPGVQAHRRLVRYRITVEDLAGSAVQVPYPDDPQPNFAYFVYDGNPGWSGRVQPPSGTVTDFSPALLDSVPTYHLLTREEDHEAAQHIPDTPEGSYGGSDYPWEGTLVYDGKVYDHIRYRSRGGVWRYAMGKNMWKFKFHDGHGFEARDDYGRKYPRAWRRMNFSAIIQQATGGQRGEQGLYEGVGFRLFNLAGVEACSTHYTQFRIVANPSEFGPTQYDGDFQGLYLAVEQPDGRFLDAHNLPEANIYKMEGGSGELKYQAGPALPDDSSDLNSFLSAYNGGTQSDLWWRENLDLERYYAYRTILEGIHHYDIGDGKNYYYFHNAETGKWQVHPWDLDLTWDNNVYGDGNEPFRSRVLVKPVFDLEFQNAAREILDLLFNGDQAHRAIEEKMSVVYRPGVPSLIDADRMMWDYNPILTSNYVNGSQAGHGRFYENAAAPGGFAGMAEKMKNYVLTRKAWIESNLLDLAVPDKPVLSYVGDPGHPVTGLAFQSSAFAAAGMAAGQIAWRIGEVSDPVNAPLSHVEGAPYVYEIDPVIETGAGPWDGAEATWELPVGALVPGRIYRARVRHGATNGRWSSWSDPVQFVAGQADVMVYQAGLVVSELLYHPRDATAAEVALGYENSDFEYIELYNAGPVTLDLGDVQFTDGIEFAFAPGPLTLLAPGARLVVVRNKNAFESRYGPGLPVGGEYPGNAFDNAGERVELSLGAGTPIRAFTYSDEPPWPVAADDGVNGYPLVLLDPESVPDHDVAANWTAGGIAGGNPGGPDAPGFDLWLWGFGLSGSSGDDLDGDDIPPLLEYVLAGGNPLVADSGILPRTSTEALDVGSGPERFAVIEITVRSGLPDVELTVETSIDLASWDAPGEVVLLESVDHGDGTQTLRYRGAEPLAAGGAPFFLRLRASLTGS